MHLVIITLGMLLDAMLMTVTILNVDVDAVHVIGFARGARGRRRTPPRRIDVAKLRRRRRWWRRRGLGLYSGHVDVYGGGLSRGGLANGIGHRLADGVRDGVRDGDEAVTLDDGFLVATGPVAMARPRRRGVHVDGDDVDGLRFGFRQAWRRRARHGRGRRGADDDGRGLGHATWRRW